MAEAPRNSIEEAVQAGLRALWAWADRNDTGQLSARERADLLRKIHLNQLTWLDDDRDGCMSFDNFLGMVNSMSPQDCSHVFVVASLLGSLRGGSAVYGTALQHLFDFFSDDGLTIPAADFKKFASRLSQDMWKAVPSEGDITFDSFAELLAPKAGDYVNELGRSGTLENVLIAGLQLLFMWMDHDGDLRLDERERGEFMLKMGLKTLSWTDHKDDGMMSFKEFREMLDAMPPSECTDISLVASLLGSLRATKPVRPNSTEEVLRLFDFFRLGGEATVNAAAFMRFAQNVNLHISSRVPDGTDWTLEQFSQVVFHEPATPQTPPRAPSGHSSKATTPRKTVEGSHLEAEGPWEIVDGKLVKQEFYRKLGASPPASPGKAAFMSRSTQHEQNAEQPSIEHLLRVVQHLTSQQLWDLHLFLLGKEGDMSSTYPVSWATAYLAPLLNICVCDQYQVWITLMRGLLERVSAAGTDRHNAVAKNDNGPEVAALRDMLLERDHEIESLKADVAKLGSNPEASLMKLDLLNRDARIADLEATLAKLSSADEDDVGHLKKELLKRDEEIRRLEVALHEASRLDQAVDLQERLARREAQISDMERAMSAMVPHAEVEALKEELQNSRAKLSAVQQAVLVMVPSKEVEALKQELRDSRAELSAAQRTLATHHPEEAEQLRQKLEDCSKLILALESQLQGAPPAEEMELLNQKLLERDGIIRSLRDQVQKLSSSESNVERLKEELLKKNEEIGRLQECQEAIRLDQVVELEERLTSREAQISHLEEEVELLKQELQDSEAKMSMAQEAEQLKQKLEEYSEHIEALEAELQAAPPAEGVEVLHRELLEREDVIDALRAQLQSATPADEVEVLRRGLLERDEIINSLRSKMQQMASRSEEDHDVFTAQLSDREKKIAELSELAETSIQMALAAEQMAADLQQQQSAQGVDDANAAQLKADIAERDAKLAELTELAENSIQLAMSVDPLRAELRAAKQLCHEEAQARAVVEGQLELLRLELLKRDARIVELENQLEVSHRILEEMQQRTAVDAAGSRLQAVISSHEVHIAALEAEQRATHERLERAAERIRSLEHLADCMFQTAFQGELAKEVHTADLSTQALQEQVERVAERVVAMQERLHSRLPHRSNSTVVDGEVVLQDFEGHFVFRNLSDVRDAMAESTPSTMVGLQTFLRLLKGRDPSLADGHEEPTPEAPPSGAQHKRRTSPGSRGQGGPPEIDSSAPDEYDPADAVALRDYSVQFIFNKLGLMKACLHRLASNGDSTEYIGLNTFLDCLRGPGPSSPLHLSPRHVAVGSQWPDNIDAAGISTPGSASPEALRRFGSVGSSLSSTQVAPDAPQRQAETMQRLQHLETALKEKVTRISDLEEELSQVRAALMAAQERLMDQDKLIHSLEEDAAPGPKPAVHVKFQDKVDVCPTAYRTVSSLSSASMVNGDAADSEPSLTVEATDLRAPAMLPAVPVVALEDTLVCTGPPPVQERPTAGAPPAAFGGDGEVARLRAEAIVASRRLQSLEALLQEQEHRMWEERMATQQQLERVRKEAVAHSVPQDVHDEVVKEVWRERLRAEALQERLLQLTDEQSRKASEEQVRREAIPNDQSREVEKVLKQEVLLCRQECQRLVELSHSKTLELQAKDDLLARLKEELHLTREECERLHKMKREKDALSKSLNVELLVQASRLKYAEEKLQLLQARCVELEFRQPLAPYTGPAARRASTTLLDQSCTSNSSLNRSTSPSLVVSHVCVLPVCTLCERLGGRPEGIPPVSPTIPLSTSHRTQLGRSEFNFRETTVEHRVELQTQSTPRGDPISSVVNTPQTAAATPPHTTDPSNPPPPTLEPSIRPQADKPSSDYAATNGQVEDIVCDSEHNSEENMLR